MSKGLSVRVEPKLLTEKGMWPCQHVSGRFGFHLIFDSFFPLVSCVYIYIIAFNCTHIIYTYIYMYYVYIHRVIYIYTCVFFQQNQSIDNQPIIPTFPVRAESLCCVLIRKEARNPHCPWICLPGKQKACRRYMGGLHDLHGRQDTSFLFGSYLHVFTYKLQTTNWSNFGILEAIMRIVPIKLFGFRVSTKTNQVRVSSCTPFWFGIPKSEQISGKW